MKTEGCGVFQQQGSCTYTEPVVVGTFANFDPNYSAATYVSLTDERDNKNYPVVKIGGRWIMARNLNYQEGLAWYANSAEPSADTGSNEKLRGVFWCPGGNSSPTVTSNSAGCDAWGALYVWETAMMLDGKGSWTEAANSTHNTGAANVGGSLINQGRTALTGNTYGGRGICPVNWHVPTDNEWGIILDSMEKDGGTRHQTASGSNWYGADAGTRGKSICTTTASNTAGDVSDTYARWYNSSLGTDVYGIRALPAGRRHDNGSYFYYRGREAYFWSSSVCNGTTAWNRIFNYSLGTVRRTNDTRSFGFSVRCIRD
jgi:uncharacterized protein (TIGR02145 family)